jgi:branched-chain amino acid transport system substrate-binding protein
MPSILSHPGVRVQPEGRVRAFHVVGRVRPVIDAGAERRYNAMRTCVPDCAGVGEEPDKVSQLDRRHALRLLAGAGLAGVAAPALSACSSFGSSSEDSGETIKIGLVLPQIPPYKVIGDDMANGFEMYVKQANGRLGGHPVKLIYADEGATADSGLAATKKLLKQDKVSVLTGVVATPTMLAIRDLVEKSQVPLLGSNASPVDMTGVRYIWRTSFVNDEPGRSLGGYLANTGKRFYVIAANYGAGHDEVGGFNSTFGDAGGKLVGQPVFTPFPDNPTFAPDLEKIKRSGAEAVFCFYAGTQAVDFVKAYHAANVGLTLYAPGFLTEGSQLLQKQAASALGIYTALNYSPDLDNVANRRFVSEYQKAYDSLPTTYAMASYDAAAVLDKAIALAGRDVSPQALNAAIGRIGQIDSPRGPWQFNQTRTPQQKWYLRKVRSDGMTVSNMVVSDLLTLG